MYVYGCLHTFCNMFFFSFLVPLESLGLIIYGAAFHKKVGQCHNAMVWYWSRVAQLGEVGSWIAS